MERKAQVVERRSTPSWLNLVIYSNDV